MSFRYLGKPSTALYPVDEKPEVEERVNVSNVVSHLLGVVDEMLPVSSCTPPDVVPYATESTDVVQVLTKAEEDALLRPPRDGEVVCMSGEHCECMQMARFPPHATARGP